MAEKPTIAMMQAQVKQKAKEILDKLDKMVKAGAKPAEIEKMMEGELKQYMKAAVDAGKCCVEEIMGG